jgi:hypothetical protein
MAIDRAVYTEAPLLPGEEPPELGIDIEIEAEDGASIEMEDGSVVIDLDPDAPEMVEVEQHDANLAEYLSDSDLDSLSLDLVSSFEQDRNSRRDWERAYKQGLKLLGIKKEDRSEPWDGACGIYHPMLAEAVVRFQSQAIQEIFPAQGPVKAKIVGTPDEEKNKQANRVRSYMNYLLTEEMTEYRPETERLLFSLPLSGSAFRKIYYDPILGRPCSKFVPAEDFYVNNAESDICIAERMTHVQKRTKNEVRKLQAAGFYRSIDLPEPQSMFSDIEEVEGEITGISIENDNRHTILEILADLDLPGFEDTHDGEETGIALPYVVSIDYSSGTVLSIRRNWYADDPLKKRRQHYAHFIYIPALGFYGFGLIHLIGGMAESSTSLMRQLVDAGTLANLPGGLKTKGLRIDGDETPIAPGEFRDVSVAAGAIRDNILPLPYKEPSQVLYQLLNDIVAEGKRFASQADMKASDMNTEAPVGTTLALLERSLKVVTALQARLHAAQKQEFKMLVSVLRDYGPTPYPNGEIDPADFDDRIDVIPVSNPNSGTMAQRIMQHQAALQLAQQAPQLYDLPLLHRQMLEALEIPDAEELVPLKGDIKPTDPVSENMNILTSKPVKAFMYQDHEAHIKTHMSMSQDPKILQLLAQAPNAQALQAAMQAHIAEHVAFQYRREIEKQLGVELPDPQEALPEDIEFRLSQLVAPAAEQLLGKDQAEAEQKRIQDQMEDPIFKQRERELQIEEQRVQSDFQAKMAKIEEDRRKAQERSQLERERIAYQERKATNDQRLKAAELLADVELEQLKLNSDEKIAGAKLGQQIAQDLKGRNG